MYKTITLDASRTHPVVVVVVLLVVVVLARREKTASNIPPHRHHATSAPRGADVQYPFAWS